MYIDRPALKRRAKDLISTSKPQPIVVGLVYVLLILLITWLSGKMSGLVFSTNELIEYSNYVAQGDVDSAMYLISSHLPSSGMSFVGLLLNIISMILSAGFVIFLLNTIRMKEACFGNLLDGFGMFFRIIWLDILQNVFITLWSLLFIVPGIIAGYRYRFAYYNLCENPDMGVMEALNMSKAQTGGFKWQLFVLDLSFLGWMLLCGLTLGILSIWVQPYILQTNVGYFQQIKAAKGIGWTPRGPEGEDHTFHPNDPFDNTDNTGL